MDDSEPRPDRLDKLIKTLRGELEFAAALAVKKDQYMIELEEALKRLCYAVSYDYDAVWDALKHAESVIRIPLSRGK